ncbi:MAG: bacterial Ig-like domain-containing protein [Bacilli bacterium]
MKKIILSLILFFGVVGLCACGNTTTTENTTTDNTTAEQTTTEQTTTEAPVPAVLELDSSAVKVAYLVGDQLNIEGLKVEEVRGEARTDVALSACTVKVLDASENEVGGTFEFAGKYTVEVSYNGNADSYEVTVSVNSYATVYEALTASVAKADTVKSGTAVLTQDTTPYNYAYEFGPNHFKYSVKNEYSDYTYFFELLDAKDSLHKPIYYYEVTPHQKCYFFIKYDNDLIIYTLKNKDRKK